MLAAITLGGSDMKCSVVITAYGASLLLFAELHW
jgi:hypothetical protein